MKAVVTGASGFVGNNLCRALQEAGVEVTALYRNPQNLNALEGMKLEKKPIEMGDYQSLCTAFAGADYVFHLASFISISGGQGGAVERTNVNGTHNAARACLECGVKRLIHFSSIHAVAFNEHTACVDETLPLADNHPLAYNRTKALGQTAAMKYVDQGLELIVLNPTGIIGPYDYRPSFMGTALFHIWRAKLPFVVNGGFNWVDVRDVCDAAVAAMKGGRNRQHYLLAGQWVSLSDIAAIMEQVTGRPLSRRAVPFSVAALGVPFFRMTSFFTGAKPLYTQEALRMLREGSKRITSALAQKELGFHPRPIKETMTDICSWFDRNFKR